MAERNPEELQREIVSAREDLLATIRRMRATVHRKLSIVERIGKHPIAVSVVSALVLGGLIGAQVAHMLHTNQRPRIGKRIAGTLRRLLNP
jgi:hypothetical protein